MSKNRVKTNVVITSWSYHFSQWVWDHSHSRVLKWLFFCWPTRKSASPWVSRQKNPEEFFHCSFGLITKKSSVTNVY